MAYPYSREAAFMTAVWPQVWLDLWLALPPLGAGTVEPLIETLALAPATKVRYGSDARGLPELFAPAGDWGPSRARRGTGPARPARGAQRGRGAPHRPPDPLGERHRALPARRRRLQDAR